MSKVIDEVVFKKSIEDMLQYLSDNCLYEFVPYDDESIANLFSLTPEEAQRLSDLISDEVVSKYKLWSSSKVNDELIAAKTECNDYTDKMLTNISSISIKYVDTLPTSDISTSTIYILKNTGGGNDTLNLYDGGAWTSIGEFTISLEDFYKKDVMDTKLNEKANKTEVLSADKVLVSAGSETHDNVYSAKLTKTELDLKANDSDVIKKTDIVDNLTSTDTDKPLSANQGMLLKSMMATLTGVVLPYAGSLVPDGFLLCNGQAVSRTTYKNLFDVIGTTYGNGDGSTTFNLPNLQNKFIQGTGTNAIGTEMSAGLPNITGETKYLSSNALWSSVRSGAFKGYTSDNNIRINNVAKDGNGDGYYFIFDASLSNPIYGNSNTVQPPAIVMNYIIKY